MSDEAPDVWTQMLEKRVAELEARLEQLEQPLTSLKAWSEQGENPSTLPEDNVEQVYAGA
jgi:BMFP domain-containing protein YqiC